MAELYNRNSPCPIAHRGCMEAGPENSHTAFEAAVTLGAGGVEIDEVLGLHHRSAGMESVL